ncbi:glutathione S-transferase [Salinicola endophyticus]|uniref:Glutathione S-transferase n=1 Tax=Salinicola endophyticus TaxID=1949083 RepID=A0AB74U8V9_9GAMM
MQLYGMLDSPYVRRVAISLAYYGQAFEHRPLSVFGDYAAFEKINPVVKAPSLMLDDGTLLLDSSLILEYLEAISSHSLLPSSLDARAAVLNRVGLALTVCEKSIQLVYEHHLRPAEKRHQPWIDRVKRQLEAGCRQLDQQQSSIGDHPEEIITQADISTAVAWSFVQFHFGEEMPAPDYPALTRHMTAMEARETFRRHPIEG